VLWTASSGMTVMRSSAAPAAVRATMYEGDSISAHLRRQPHLRTFSTSFPARPVGLAKRVSGGGVCKWQHVGDLDAQPAGLDESGAGPRRRNRAAGEPREDAAGTKSRKRSQACHAVKPTSGSAAVCTWSRPSGLRANRRDEAATYLA